MWCYDMLLGGRGRELPDGKLTFIWSIHTHVSLAWSTHSFHKQPDETHFVGKDKAEMHTVELDMTTVIGRLGGLG